MDTSLGATFPTGRLRRLRMNERLRSMVRETEITPADFIYPLFVVPGAKVKREISSMPGVYQMSVDEIVRECAEVYGLGIPAVIFFGIPETKDEVGSGAYDENGIVQRALRAVKKEVPELLLITDVCLCEYTSHGHCGIVRGEKILNDESVELLTREALTHAQAGADMIAPSDMFDGRVGAIRAVLDRNGYGDLPIMSYAAKYASGFYGPFREAAESTPKFGDRRSHQMDPANVEEALREVAAGYPGRGGYRDGQAGAFVPRRDLPRQEGVRNAHGRVQRQRGVFPREGRCTQRLGRWRTGHDGGADEHPACGRRHHPHLLREGSRPAVAAQRLTSAGTSPCRGTSDDHVHSRTATW